MTSSIAWKIALPTAATRAAPPQEKAAEQRPVSSEERKVAEEALSGWLGAVHIRTMKDKDVEILASETSSLAERASRNSRIWHLFPNIADIPTADRLISEFRDAAAREQERGAESKALCKLLDLDWNGSATGNIVAGDRITARYTSAAGEVGTLAQALETWTGTAPTIQDASFIIAISASLRMADIQAMSGATGLREEVDRARGMIDELDKAAAELIAEFSFDPSEHSAASFGGISRAFASGRAQDFLAAARKLGITPKGPDQAQRAAGLLKKYIAGLAEVAPSSAGGDHPAGVIARARLALSVARRTEVLGIDLQRLSPSVRNFDLLDFGFYPVDGIQTISPDTRKLIEDNAVATPVGTPVEGLSSELSRQADAIAEWIERQRRGLSLLGADGTHDQVETILQMNPQPEGFGPSLENMQELEAAEEHVLWLHEAMMLPLADEQLAAFVAYLAGRAD
ncbi:hypothetical protein D3C71_258920 [compost metagenome]